MASRMLKSKCRAVHSIVNSKQSAMKQFTVTPTKDFTKRKKPDSDATSNEETFESMDYFNILSLETLCHILGYLPLNDVMKLESLCRKLHESCTLHLRLLTEIDFTEGEIYGWMPLTLNDYTFKKLLSRCPNLISVYGLHPCYLAKRRQLCYDSLSVPGIVEGLSICTHLEYVETSDIFLLEALLMQLPHITVGDFRNRNGHFPVPISNRLNLVRGNSLTSLQLHGVTVSDIPRMDNLRHLHLRFVKLSDPHPFRDFACPELRSFVMSHCAGPADALKYVPLVTGLASAPELSRMELVRVPFLGGLFQHVVEDRWRSLGFRSLEKITFGACKHALETDIGYLLIASSNRLHELSLQPSLTRDSFFSSLIWTDIDFPMLESINLGHVDSFPEPGKWSNADLSSAHGLADIVEIPSMMTDIGMNAAGRVFETCRNLSIYNAPHLHHPTSWFSPGLNCWRRLQYVHIRRCHAVWLQDFCQFIGSLQRLESLYIDEMFREPPRGCSRVGLSAGTGLGVSSALVTNTGNDVAPTAAANQQPANNAAPNDAANQQLNNNVGAQPAAANAADDNLVEEDAANPQNEQEEQNESEEDQVVEHELQPPSYEDAKNYPENEDDFYDDKLSGESKRTFGGFSSANCHSSVPHASTCRKSSAMSCCEDMPGPSGCKASCAELAGEKEQFSCGSTSDAGMDFDIVGGEDSSKNTKGAACAEPAVIAKCCHCGSVVQSPNHTASNVESIDPDISATMSKSGCSSVIENLQPSGSTEKGFQRVKGKGKSLQGKKKGIAKNSAHNQQVHKSCQAISEEIREAAKKAKEDGDECAADLSNGMNLSTASSADQSLNSSTSSNQSEKSGSSSGDQPEPNSKASQVDTKKVSQMDKRQQREDVEQSQNRRQLRSDTLARSNTLCLAVPGTPSLPPGAIPQLRRKPPTVDKCTSTSDPVIEDDHIPQILTIKSQSLVNLSLRMVGVTDLVIEDCPRLQILSGSNCRVLKNVVMKTAPRLIRTSFLQCPRLRCEDLVDELCIQPPEKNRLLFLRPMSSSYSVSELENCLLSNPEYNYHLCIIHDYSPDPSATLYNRRRVASWLDLLATINFELLRFMEFPEAHSSNHCGDDSYPWGRQLHRMYGRNANGSRWEMLTDVPWLPTLASAPDLPSSKVAPDDTKPGLYCPRAKGHTNTDVWLEHLAEDIAEARESGYKIYSYTAVIYVNMCDLVGVAVPDIYV